MRRPGPGRGSAAWGATTTSNIIAGFDHLVANTDYIAEWVVGQGWPARQVSCIPNFAAPPLDGPPADRAALTTPTDAPLLLAMGRLHEAKAHDVSLRVLTELPDAWLWIAGAGPAGG